MGGIHINKVSGEYPYQDFWVHRSFDALKRRWVANLTAKNGQSRTTMHYARYLMATYLKRVLGEDEHVDHINDNRTDDRLENLQILTRLENILKTPKPTGRTQISRNCLQCGKQYLVAFKYRFKSKFCSTVCYNLWRAV